MGLLDFLRRRPHRSGPESGRTPEEERSGDPDQVRPESTTAEDITDPSRVPGEDEPDRPQRMQ